MSELQPVTQHAASATPGPLAGLTVLDFTHAAAGPLCTMLMADFGARVIKVEKPYRGDGSRHMRMTGKYANAQIGSDYYLGLNRNKLDVGLDIATPEGAALAKRLAATADILVQNFRPGTLDKLGLGYDELRKINPRLIYCDVAAFPAQGPLSTAPGMDIVVQARAGTIAMTGFPGGEPVKPGPSLSDMSGGLQALIGILLALRHRDATGAGQRVAVNLYHATLLMLSNYASVVLNTEEDVEPMGSGHPQLAPYQAFPAADRWFFIAVGTNGLWRRMCAALKLEAIQDDPRFATNWARVKNKPALVEILNELFRTRPATHWLKLMDEAGIPASSIITPREAFMLEREQSSAIVSAVEHPDYGTTYLPGLPIALSATPGAITRAPPRIGEDTDRVLGALGMDQAELRRLGARGIIQQYGVDQAPKSEQEAKP
jgi:crotonobetainyl-CoA:carnitine CoA-transferase CaiB-like acyl-CoA transferase